MLAVRSSRTLTTACPQTTVVYLNDDGSAGAKGRSHTVGGLSWGRGYCVRMQVVGNTAVKPSNVSEPQCVLLPEPGEAPANHRTVLQDSITGHYHRTVLQDTITGHYYRTLLQL